VGFLRAASSRAGLLNGRDRLLRELKQRTGVAATNTRVILRTTIPRR
jgi:hypothetical protein